MRSDSQNHRINYIKVPNASICRPIIHKYTCIECGNNANDNNNDKNILCTHTYIYILCTVFAHCGKHPLYTITCLQHCGSRKTTESLA